MQFTEPEVESNIEDYEIDAIALEVVRDKKGVEL